MPAARVVITDCDHTDIAPERRVLSEAGHSVELLQCRTVEELVEATREADAVITQYAPMTAEVLGSLERCKVVVRYGVGVDNVDVEAATSSGIWVANVPDYGVDEVADHTLAFMLALLRKLVPLRESVRSGAWRYQDAEPVRRIATQTVGVVGCGRIGSQVVSRVRCQGARVLVDDPAGVPDHLKGPGIAGVTFGELLEQSDVVSLHVPLTPETKHLIGARELARMKPTAYLVNTSRGAIVDQDALVAALDAGQIAGAALDVLDGEPPDEYSAVARHPNVLITPHSAWYSEESYEVLKSEAAREVVRVLAGGYPRSAVNWLDGDGRRA